MPKEKLDKGAPKKARTSERSALSEDDLGKVRGGSVSGINALVSVSTLKASEANEDAMANPPVVTPRPPPKKPRPQ
jgi:hypothetical protein